MKIGDVLTDFHGKCGALGSNRPVQQLVREVRDRLEAFTDGQPPADDTTIVAGKSEG